MHRAYEVGLDVCGVSEGVGDGLSVDCRLSAYAPTAILPIVIIAKTNIACNLVIPDFNKRALA